MLLFILSCDNETSEDFTNNENIKADQGLEKESIALCHQIRTIDKKRLSKHYGHLSKKSLQKKVIEALKFQIGID